MSEPELLRIGESRDPLHSARRELERATSGMERAEALLDEQGPEAAPVVEEARRRLARARREVARLEFRAIRCL